MTCASRPSVLFTRVDHGAVSIAAGGAGQVPCAPLPPGKEPRDDRWYPCSGAGTARPDIPAETAWEDVQAARPELLPLWAEIPEATAAAEDCISALNLRYQLSGSVVTPVPSRDRLRRDLRDKYLWLSGESGQETALRWVYIVGAGWKQPAFLRQWKRTGHPLVLRCQADGLTEQGAYILLETLPWEYDVLMRRTLEQREREAERIEYSHEQSSMQLNTRTYLPKAEQQVQSGPKIGGLGEMK